MGVQLRDIIPEPAIRNVEPDFFAGKTVAVDAFNAIYQFLATIRQQDGTPLMDAEGKITSHLSGVFYRNARLLEAGVKVVYVFDGKAPIEKRETIEKREENKKIAEKNYEEAKEAGDMESARKYAQATSRLTDEMLAETKELLIGLGIPIVQAPAEGESEAAFLCKSGKVDYSVSQDYDSLLFGCPNLVRNLSVTNKRKVPGRSFWVDAPTEIIDLQGVLNGLNLTREKLIALGILVGTDYNPGGIRGIGPKKGLALLQKGAVSDVFKEVKDKWTFGIRPEDLMELFLKPKIDEKVYIRFEKFDSDKIKKVLCQEHGFSIERIDNTIKKIEETQKEAGKQKELSKWF
jgi:flap endonuclease-1